MRIDDFLSTVGLVKRRTVANQLGKSGLLTVNGRSVKPSYQVRLGDIVAVKGSRPLQAEIIEIPTGSVPREQRERFVREISP